MPIVAIGSEGNVTLPTNSSALINTWSASISRATSVITGFGDTGARRLASKVVDITGSASGTPQYDVSAGSAVDGIIGNQAAGTITLTWVASPACTLEFDCIMSSVALSTSMGGEAAVTFNFECADENAPVFTWEETD